MKTERRLKQKLLYWDYFRTNKKYWGHGITAKNLDEARGSILCYGELWNDVLHRHNGINLSPNALRKEDKFMYDHCMGNMSGMIIKELINLKLIKR